MLKTSQGPLFVRELTQKDLGSKDIKYKVAKFEVDNFSRSSIEPGWDLYQDSSYEKYGQQLRRFEAWNQEILAKKDGNSTVMIAEDSKKNLRALFSAHVFDEFEGIEDDYTVHVDTCIVDNKFRGLGLGKIFFNKLMDITKGHFTDVYLEAYNKHKSFYENMGLKELDTNNPVIKNISDLIRVERDDAPKYVTLMSKPLLPNQSRWWERIAKSFG